MIHKPNLGALRMRLQSTSLLAIAAVVAAAGLAPLYYQSSASAATLTTRSVAISDSTPAQTGVTYLITFTPATNSIVQSFIVQACTTPLGSCTLPGGGTKLNISAATVANAWTGTDSTAFGTETTTDTGACTEGDGGAGVATMYCANRTSSTSELTSQAATITLTSVGNPSINSGNNEQVYLRITTYSDTAYATAVDSGVVAASIVNQLTVTGRVQERLVFCVFALDDTAGSNATVGAGAGDYPTNCAASEATASSNVDMGVIDNTAISRSPVDNSPPASTGNDRFGAAMVNTNASSGVTISYYPAAASSGTNQLRSFRVTGASCNASNANLTDQCFQDAATTGTTLAAGSERFGLHIACLDNSTTPSAPGTTANLGAGGNGNGTLGTFNNAYDNNSGAANFASMQDGVGNNCENTDPNSYYSWDSSGSSVNLISSSTVVDDELIKLRFAATAEATTPTGTYTVATVYIATPVF